MWGIFIKRIKSWSYHSGISPGRKLGGLLQFQSVERVTNYPQWKHRYTLHSTYHHSEFQNSRNKKPIPCPHLPSPSAQFVMLRGERSHQTHVPPASFTHCKPIHPLDIWWSATATCTYNKSFNEPSMGKCNFSVLYCIVFPMILAFFYTLTYIKKIKYSTVNDQSKYWTENMMLNIVNTLATGYVKGKLHQPTLTYCAQSPVLSRWGWRWGQPPAPHMWSGQPSSSLAVPWTGNIHPQSTSSQGSNRWIL